MILKTIAAALVGVAASICAIEEKIACTHGFLCQLVGNYEASGTSFKKPARLAMRWAPDLGGAFVRIDYRIDASSPKTRERFDGVGYYKSGGVNRFVGTWVDSQGAVHPLDASVAGRTLTTFWGVRGKGAYGRTTYRLLDERRVEVVDAVLGGDGVWSEFSRNTLTKTE
jgi:hypothetical protein